MGLWRRYLDWRRRHVPALEMMPGGFRLVHGRASRAVAWADIRRITAFKRDLYTTDCICLLLALPETIIEIDEEMDGFALWRAAMERHVNISPSWYVEIMMPAFAATPRDLYLHPDLTEPT